MLEVKLNTSRRGRPLVWTAAIGFAILTLVVHGYRLSAAPDIFSDEGLYLLVGQNLALGHGLVADKGTFLWHPPLYMLIEAAYIKGASLAVSDPVRLLFMVRWLNVVFSAATASLLVLLGRQLHSLRAGCVMAALFVLDPYVQRINRRSMLETLAELLTICALYIFVFYRRRRKRRNPWRWIGSGVAFGLAALTKEAMLLQLLTLVGFAMWDRREDLWDAIRATAVALLTFSSFIAWTLATGNGEYLNYQLFQLSRILAPIFGRPALPLPPGTNLQIAPQAQSVGNLQSLLPQYVMSYLVIGLGAISVLVMLIWWRRRLETHLLISWSIVSFIGMGFLARVSDQYFYYIIVPATVAFGYVCMAILDSMATAGSQRQQPRVRIAILRTGTAQLSVILIAVLVITIASYNGRVWFLEYATGSDDAYAQVFSYVRDNVPPGTTIVASDAVAKYFLPNYNVRFDRDSEAVLRLRVRYFIMSSKDAGRAYEGMTPAFYDWVIGNSRLLFLRQGGSFGKLGVYERPRT